MTDESEIKSNQSVEDKSTNESSLYRTSGHLQRLQEKIDDFVEKVSPSKEQILKFYNIKNKIEEDLRKSR